MWGPIYEDFSVWANWMFFLHLQERGEESKQYLKYQMTHLTANILSSHTQCVPHVLSHLKIPPGPLCPPVISFCWANTITTCLFLPFSSHLNHITRKLFRKFLMSGKLASELGILIWHPPFRSQCFSATAASPAVISPSSTMLSCGTQ